MERLIIGLSPANLQQSCLFVNTFGILVLKKQRAALKKAVYSLHQLAILAIITDNNQE